jgi:hypothetical protein
MSESFDAFFVGDGSRELMVKQTLTKKKRSIVDKTQEHPYASLTGGLKDEVQFEVVDDVKDYVTNRIDISEASGYQDAFLMGKKEVYSRFNFLSIKSAVLRGRAVREVDLILEDSDFHILEYLQEHVKDYYAVRSVAQLVAYESMGIYEVMFQGKDDCSLCLAVEGAIRNTRNLIQVFTSGGFLPHPYCDCSFFPVIRRSSYQGVLTPHLDLDSRKVEGTTIYNFPIEHKEGRLCQMLVDLPFEKVSFTDMHDYRNTILLVKDVDSVVIHYNEEEETLYVHNDYIGTSGPFQYVSEYLKAVTVPAKVPLDTLEGLERYYLDGRTAVLWQDNYWDVETGERIK